MNNNLSIAINIDNIDDTIEKTNQLIMLLKEAQSIIDSLGKTIITNISYR